MRHITTALPGGAPPVRANSHRVGQCERGWWTATPRAELRRIVMAARIFDRLHRQRGRRNGPLGHVALEVLDLLGNLADTRTGRLEPSLAWLMARLKRSRDAICRALAALKAHGFLDWLRRYRPTHRDGAGPRVTQASNAYRLSLPRLAARLLRPACPSPSDDDLGKPEPVRELNELDLALAAFSRDRESARREGVDAMKL